MFDANFVIGIVVGAAIAAAAFLTPIGRPSQGDLDGSGNGLVQELHVLRKKLKFVMGLNLVHEGIDPRTMQPLLIDKREAIRELVRMECSDIKQGEWDLGSPSTSTASNNGE